MDKIADNENADNRIAEKFDKFGQAILISKLGELKLEKNKN